MAQERLAVRKIHEILRPKEEACLSNRANDRACKIYNSSVAVYLRRMEEAQLHWPLLDRLNESELHQKINPENNGSVGIERSLPNWEDILQELKKKGVTLKLLWIEYHDDYSEGYKYTQLGVYY